MEKKLVALVLVALLAGLGGGIGLGWILRHRTYGGACVHVDVGVYYYGWYHAGYGNRHWNDSWEWASVIEEPFLSYYGSNDNILVKRHIAMLDDLGVDFVLISWHNGSSPDDNIDTFIKVRKTFGHVKFAVCVEPYNRTDDTEGTYNYTWIHNYIYTHYCNYSFYYHYEERPLLCYIGGGGSNLAMNLPQNQSFTQRIIGECPNFPHWQKTWTYTSILPHKYWCRDANDAKVYNRATDVCPRYDGLPKRSPNVTINGGYAEGVYEREWRRVIEQARKGNIDIIMITSFNEFHERTQIEPTYDTTSSCDNPFHIYNLTKQYISKLRNLSDLSKRYYDFQAELTYVKNITYLLTATTITLTVTTIYLAKRKPKS